MQDKLLDQLDGLLVTNPTNIRYLTGFVGVAPEERESYVLLTNNAVYLFTNSLYIEQAKQLTNLPIYQLANQFINKLTNKTITKIEVVEISRENPFSQALRTVLLSTFIGQTLQGVPLGFEEENVTVAEFEKLKKELPSALLIPTSDRIENLRMIKSTKEIEHIRAASYLTDQCFEFVIQKIKPGVTESQIAWEIETFIRTRGAELAFSPIVAFGKHSSQPHYNVTTSSKLSFNAPQSLALDNQDIVLLDFGARVNGYCSDITRMVFVGTPKDEWVKAYKTVLAAYEGALNELKDSMELCKATKQPFSYPGGGLDMYTRKIIEHAGYTPYPHSLGHGVGLEIHEDPRLSVRKDRILLSGMAITIEPGIYIEGQFGIRIEDTIFIDTNDIELLTKSKRELIVVNN